MVTDADGECSTYTEVSAYKRNSTYVISNNRIKTVSIRRDRAKNTCKVIRNSSDLIANYTDALIVFSNCNCVCANALLHRVFYIIVYYSTIKRSTINQNI